MNKKSHILRKIRIFVMNTNELENHVKTRLGSTLTGASKEVREVFGAGMFSVRSKQKANLFSLSLRKNIEQDINSGHIKSVDELDSIIDKALKEKEITYSKASVEFKEDLINTALFTAKVPQDGSSKYHKKVKNAGVTIHDKGLQIHGAGPGGSNLKLEWDAIVEASRDGKKIILTLSNGSHIFLKANMQVTKETVKHIDFRINEKICGVPEKGWD